MKKFVIAAKDEKSDQLSFLTVKETAGYLHLCEKQVRRLISRGELPAYRFGTALRIKRGGTLIPMSGRSNYIRLTRQ